MGKSCWKKASTRGEAGASTAARDALNVLRGSETWTTQLKKWETPSIEIGFVGRDFNLQKTKCVTDLGYSTMPVQSLSRAFDTSFRTLAKNEFAKSWANESH